MELYVSDIETNGLYYEVDKFHCAVVRLADEDNTLVGKYRPNDFKKYLDDLTRWQAEGSYLVFHNGIGYDQRALTKLAKLKGIDFKVNENLFIDTLVLSRLLYSDIRTTDFSLWKKGKLPPKMIGSHSLKAWGYRLGLLKGTYGEQEDAWDEFSEDMLEYNDLDVVVTSALLRKMVKDNPYYFKADEKYVPLIEAIELEHKVAFLLTKMEDNGFPFDVRSAEKLEAELQARRTELRLELIKEFGSWYDFDVTGGGFEYLKDPLTGKELTMYPKFKVAKVNQRGRIKGVPYLKTKPVEFNPSSRDHIIKVLKERGWKPTEFTDNGKPIVDDEVLQGVVLKDKDAQRALTLVSEYLMLTKRLGQISEGKNAWLRLVHKDGIMRGSVNPNGAVTGRATHSYPNIAQVPANGAPYGKECRRLFGAIFSKKGWVQVGTDASGLELRGLSHFLYPFDNGEYAHEVVNGDIHTKNQLAAGLPTRDNAKTFIYGFLYGAGAAKIGSIVNGSSQQGNKLKKAFLAKTPQILKLINAIQGTLASGSRWEGREQVVDWKRRWIRGLDGRKVAIRSLHAALNSVLQSAGAVICKYWIVETERLLLEAGYKHGWDGDFAYMAWVHDEMQIAARTEEIANKIGELAQQAMRNTQEHFNFRCQLDTDYKVGKTWEDCH